MNIDGNRCVKCGRKRKTFKKAPFSETFWAVILPKTDIIYSICPDCHAEWEKIRAKRLNELNDKLHKDRYVWLGIRQKERRTKLICLTHKSATTCRYGGHRPCSWRMVYTDTGEFVKEEMR